MVIDVHTHLYPDALAPKALRVTQEEHGIRSFTDGTLSALESSMEKAGVDLSVVLPVATRLGQNPKLNDFARSISHGRLLSFGSVFHQEPDWKGQIDHIVELGLKGIKFHPDFQEFYLHEAHIIDMVRYCVDKGLLVILHVGIDPICLELIHSTPEMARHLIDRVGPERVILAHLGGHLYWDEVLEHICGSGCYIDTALACGAINSRKFLKILAAHGADRVLFGSDSPWGDQEVALRWLRSLPIPEEDREKILCQNASRLLGM